MKKTELHKIIQKHFDEQNKNYKPKILLSSEIKNNKLPPFFVKNITKGKINLSINEKATVFDFEEFYDFYCYIEQLLTNNNKESYKLSDILMLLASDESSFVYLNYWINLDSNLKNTLLKFGINNENDCSKLKNIFDENLDKLNKELDLLNDEYGSYMFDFALFLSTDNHYHYSFFIIFSLCLREKQYFDLEANLIVIQNIQNVWNLDENTKYLICFDELNGILVEENLNKLKDYLVLYLVSHDFKHSINQLKTVYLENLEDSKHSTYRHFIFNVLPVLKFNCF